MLHLKKRIQAFSKLGKELSAIANKDNIQASPNSTYGTQSQVIRNLIVDSYRYNGWFTEGMVRHMVSEIGESLHDKMLNKWIDHYMPQIENKSEAKTIAVVMAGNIPLVGFHDFLTILISGHHILAKLSSDDDKLLPAVSDLLIAIEPGFKDCISFTNEKLVKFDAIIATGSNNTARYFDYYFGKYPHIIRKNRNGIAFLTGTESTLELKSLSKDIFLYYGLGCRNVSKLYVPLDYNFEPLLDVLAEDKAIVENHKYFNNYEYNKAIYLVNSTVHFDNGVVLAVEDSQIPSPVSVLHFEYYSSVKDVQALLKIKQDEVQCVVSTFPILEGTVPPGRSQQPRLWDYADNVDTMNFVLSID